MKNVIIETRNTITAVTLLASAYPTILLLHLIIG